MSDSLEERFRDMVTADTPEVTWRVFAATLPVGAFDLLRDFLAERQSIRQMAATRTAFLEFARARSDFRDDMASQLLQHFPLILVPSSRGLCGGALMSNKSSASSQVIALPSGGGAQHGIGEEFSPELPTGQHLVVKERIVWNASSMIPLRSTSYEH